MSSRDSPAHSTTKMLTPHEEALQALCKSLLKSRLFRGYYKERRYVDSVFGYRDIVALQRDERDLEKLLLDMSEKLQFFYHRQATRMWVGITSGAHIGTTWQSGALETCVWAELADLAFGQYWFSIKSVRFRDNEILLKLKMVRPIEDDVKDVWQRRRVQSIPTAVANVAADTAMSSSSRNENNVAVSTRRTVSVTTESPDAQIGLQDFLGVVEQWGVSIKHTAYDFVSNDISKENLKGLLRFMGLLIVSLLSGALVFIKFLGVFTLRFMFECSRITHALTPIILKMIEMLNKIVGGFFILLAMIWRDLAGKRSAKADMDFREIEYNKPLYQSIQYNVRQQHKRPQTKRSTEFERKFQ